MAVNFNGVNKNPNVARRESAQSYANHSSKVKKEQISPQMQAGNRQDTLQISQEAIQHLKEQQEQLIVNDNHAELQKNLDAVSNINQIMLNKTGTTDSPHWTEKNYPGETTFAETYPSGGLFEAIKQGLSQGMSVDEILEAGSTGFADDIKANQKAREQINNSINQLLNENGIVIPEGTEITFTVDPYDYKIHAIGADEELGAQIEAALNKGDNGKNLYRHIEVLNPANVGGAPSAQYLWGIAEGGPKLSVFNAVKEFTGYDLRGLENKDGKFLTPDGQDVWELVEQGYKEMCKKEGVESLPGFNLKECEDVYNKLAEVGWDNMDDKNLSISYKDGQLYDFAAKDGYGSGQTEWMDDIFAQDKINKAEHQERKKQYEAQEAAERKTAKSMFISDEEIAARQAEMDKQNQQLKELVNSLSLNGSNSFLSSPANNNSTLFDLLKRSIR